ncbi:hypothetical protein L1887_56658 [Cichorium endivia]|nr:hypothetical protein L1887_56658 [Cichorium endivia]
MRDGERQARGVRVVLSQTDPLAASFHRWPSPHPNYSSQGALYIHEIHNAAYPQSLIDPTPPQSSTNVQLIMSSADTASAKKEAGQLQKDQGQLQQSAELHQSGQTDLNRGQGMQNCPTTRPALPGGACLGHRECSHSCPAQSTDTISPPRSSYVASPPSLAQGTSSRISSRTAKTSRCPRSASRIRVRGRCRAWVPRRNESAIAKDPRSPTLLLLPSRATESRWRLAHVEERACIVQVRQRPLEVQQHVDTPRSTVNSITSTPRTIGRSLSGLFLAPPRFELLQALAFFAFLALLTLLLQDLLRITTAFKLAHHLDAFAFALLALLLFFLTQPVGAAPSWRASPARPSVPADQIPVATGSQELAIADRCAAWTGRRSEREDAIDAGFAHLVVARADQQPKARIQVSIRLALWTLVVGRGELFDAT